MKRVLEIFSGKVLLISSCLLAILYVAPAKAACFAPPAGLVGWWQGEGNALDATGANNGLIQGGLIFSNAKAGQGFLFDGSNAAVKVSASASLNVGTGAGFTVECWMKPSNTFQADPIVEWNDGVNYGVHFYVNISDTGNLYANLFDNNGQAHIFSTGSGIITNNVFQHVALSYDKASGVLMMYRNGTVVFQQAIGTFTPQTAYDFYIGKRASDILDFTGTLDEVSLYSRALTTNEINSIYQAGAFGKCQQVVTSSVPVIANFSPPAGITGAAITVSGANFSAINSLNIVYFGAVRATVLSANTNTLSVTVPVGATYAPITVTVNGLTASANSPFMPTFNGNGLGLTSASFSGRIDLPTLSGPTQTAIADLDGDGKPDLIVGDDYNNSISIYRNLSSGGTLSSNSFAARVDLPTTLGTYSPMVVVVADVDGDGRLDIITTEYSDNLVSVYRNTSTPGNLSSNTFATRIDFVTGTAPQGLAVRDLNGDGKPDLVIANSGDGTISLLRNTGNAGSLTTNSFAPKVDISTGAGCSYLSIGDLDGDGKADMVTANADSLSVFKNLGTAGAFTTNSFARTDLPSLSNLIQASIVDVDADGKPDLAVTAYLPQTFSLYRNVSTNGVLDSNSFATRVDYPLFGRGHTVSAGDLDGDGKADLAVDTELNDALSIFRNTSAPGIFTSNSLAARVDLVTGYNTWGNSIGDLDGDGRPDLVVSAAYAATLSIFQNVTPNGSSPMITGQPSNLTVIQGTPVTFVVMVNGTAPFSYQWAFNGTNIFGATSSTLVLSNVQPASAGSYSVTITNLFGTTTSSNALLIVTSTPACSPPSGMVGWWTGDGTAVDVIGGNNGVVVNAGYTNGIVNSGFSFEPNSFPYGTYTGIQIADRPAYALTNSLTIEGWVRPRGDSYIIFSRGDNRPGLDPFTLSMQGNNHVAFLITDPSGNYALVETTLNYNQWTHVAATLNGSLGTIAIYTNGVLAVATNTSVRPIGALQADQSPGVGIGNLNDGGNNFPFIGDIDEIALYDRALSALEIGMLYNSGAAGKCLTPAPPVIISQPTNVTTTIGGSAAFTVIATGPSLNFQWAFNGTNIFGATSSTLVLPNVQPASAGSYSVTITNLFGSTNSYAAGLTVFVPPTPPGIVSQTSSQTVQAGSAATFTVNASGSDPLAYFWRRNGSPISGATNASYTLFNAQLSDSGSKFSCVVSNLYGSAASTNATLKVINTIANDLCSGAIVITNSSYTNLQSTLPATSFGDPAVDCVDSFGNGVWYQFTAPASGLLAVDTFGSDFDTGLAIFTGGCGSLMQIACNDDTDGVTSQITIPVVAGMTYAILAGGYSAHAGNLVFHSTLFTPPVFVGQPTNQTVVVSSNAVISATLTGSLPMTFQWYFNDTPLADGGRISGSTNATLNLVNVQTNDNGSYQLVASNFLGVTTSSVATLTAIILPPVIVQQPLTQTIVAGSNAVFSVNVNGTAPFNFQWYYNGTPLADDGHFNGATTATLTVSNLVLFDTGNYSVTVTNISGSTNSAAAGLTVLSPPMFTLQPLGRSVPPGLPTTFTATVSGNPTSYQWQLNGTNIPGANSVTYSITAVGSNHLGTYHLIATNLLGSTTSVDAPLTFGAVAAWGRNLSNESLPPAGLTNVTAIAGALSASFAVRTDGTIASWGATSATNVLASATNVIAIAASSFSGHYALRADGTVVGWNGILPPALTNITAIAAGNSFGLALRAEGTVVGWGIFPQVPAPAGLNNIIAIACGATHSIALRSDGTIATWGTGPAITNLPASLTNVIAIAAGATHSLALKANGSVVAWGFGKGTNLPAGLTNIVAISATSYGQSQNLCLALRANGKIVVWGDNNGFGETNPPAALTNLFSVAIAAAPFHGLALVNDGSPQMLHPPAGLTAYNGRDVTLHGDAVGAAPLSYQWLFNGTNIPGANGTSLVISNIQLANAGNYQLSVSNNIGTLVSLPALVTVISNGAPSFLSLPIGVTNVYQGGKVTLGVSVLGSGPLRYQWYFSPTNKNYTPVNGATNDTLNLDPVLALHSGNYYVAVSNMVGGVTNPAVNVRVLFSKSWGYFSLDAPFILTNATAIAVGNNGSASSFGHYLALSAAGKISSWSGFILNYAETNFSALSNSFVTAISAGNQDSLALKSDGTVYAIGYNLYGESTVPAGLSGVTAIASGDYHHLALKSDGTLVGWGQNIYQQLTNAAATNIVAIAAGGQNSMVLRADGSAFTWGQFGNNNQYPVPFNATNLIAIAAGTSHFLALRANGTVVAWGDSGSGKLNVPANLSNVVAIAASGNHSTALRNDGTVVAWGSYVTGNASNSVPADLANVIAIASGGEHDVALFGTRAPAVTVQPWNRSFIFNTVTNLMLAAKFAGVQPVRYQWQCNGTNLIGATNDVLILTNQPFLTAQMRYIQPGNYQLIASNAYGVTATKFAKVTMIYPLGDALDTPFDGKNYLYNWSVTGNAQWFGQTNITHDGVDAARSGAIGASQETVLQTTVGTNFAGRYTFWWKVSSEQDFDFLEFRVNGVVQAAISGEVNWQQASIPAAAGTNVLQWRYSKDFSYDAGFDAGWVDQFTFVPDAPVFVIQPVSKIANAGTSVSLTATATGAPQMRYQWWQDGNPVGGNSPTLTLNNVARAQSGTYCVTVTNAGGMVCSSNANVKVLIAQTLGAPKVMADGTFQLTSTDADGGSLQPSDLANFEAQASTDLKNWTTLTNGLIFTNGALQLQDPGSSNWPSRYYRILEH